MKAPDGSWILDSVANNATAHYLHNMFYVLGGEPDKSVYPINVTEELYRANNIDNFDTTAIKAMTAEGTEILFISSHVVKNNYRPVFEYVFEKGIVKYQQQADNNIYAVFADGTTKNYGNPNLDNSAKLWMAMDCIRYGNKPVCGIEAAMAQTICINGAQDSSPEIQDFSDNIIKYDEKTEVKRAAGLFEILYECFDKGIMPADTGCSWAKPGKVVNLGKYKHFPIKR